MLGLGDKFPSAQAGVLERGDNFSMFVYVLGELSYFDLCDCLTSTFIQLFSYLVQVSSDASELSRRIPKRLRSFHGELRLVGEAGSNAIDYPALRRASLGL